MLNRLELRKLFWPPERRNRNAERAEKTASLNRIISAIRISTSKREKFGGSSAVGNGLAMRDKVHQQKEAR